MRTMAEQLALDVRQFQIVPGIEEMRHHVFVELVDAHTDAEAVACAIDDALRDLNVEYASKRDSQRLQPPAVYLMRPGWAERIALADFAAGKREQQYKWPLVRESRDERGTADILCANVPFASRRQP